MRKSLFPDNTSYPLPILHFLFVIIALAISAKSQGQQGFSRFSSADSRCVFLYSELSFTPCFAILNANPALTSTEIEGQPHYVPARMMAEMAGNAITMPDSDTMYAWDADSSDQKEISTAETSKKLISDSLLTYVDNGSAAPEYTHSVYLDKGTAMLARKYSEMIESAPEDMSNMRLYQFIDDWYGVRYRWGGTERTGIDCSGFSQKLYGSIYSLKIVRTARQQHRNCEIVRDYGNAQEGDLVFFRMHHLGISHVGVYLANGYFVHASRSRGVVISSLGDRYWRRRYAGCGHMAREERQGTESGMSQ